MSRCRFPLALAFSAMLPLFGGAASAAEPSFHLVKTVPLGGPDKWDYLAYDQDAHRLYVAHGTEVAVLDGRSGALVGRVTGLTGAHGVALVPELGRAYVTNNGRATAFDLNSLATVQDIPTGDGADAIAYDPASRRVFSINGKAATASAIDPTTNAVVATIPLNGKPEFAVADGLGKLYVNIESTREIVRIDTQSLQVDARWPIPDCEEPHGLAVDAKAHRLFASCVNARLVVVNADSGQILATPSIGKGSDAVAFDPVRKVVFSSNGEGTLSIIAEQDAAHFLAQEPVVTAPGARTMAVDDASGRVFLVTADPDTQTQGEGQRRRFMPGTVKVLLFDVAESR